MEKHDVERVKHYGPHSFEDAQFVEQMYIKAVQSSLAATDFDEMCYYMSNVRDWMQWLPKRAIIIDLECRKRMYEVPKLTLDYMQLIDEKIESQIEHEMNTERKLASMKREAEWMKNNG